MTDDLPSEAERLLAVSPDEFIVERQRLVRELRDSGRSAEATAVGRLRKPPPVVLAVNRAARDRPKAARAAADAAVRLKKAQLADDRTVYEGAQAELEASLDLLAEVALAHVAPSGKPQSDAMRRRLRDLLRNAVADEEARESLARGVLATETETTGFASYAGMVPSPGRRKRSAPPARAGQQAQARERARALRDELTRAELRLKEATRSVREAERERAEAERLVASLRGKLSRR